MTYDRPPRQPPEAVAALLSSVSRCDALPSRHGVAALCRCRRLETLLRGLHHMSPVSAVLTTITTDDVRSRVVVVRGLYCPAVDHSAASSLGRSTACTYVGVAEVVVGR